MLSFRYFLSVALLALHCALSHAQGVPLYPPPPEDPRYNIDNDCTNEVPFQQLRIRHLTLPNGSQFALVTNLGITPRFYRGEDRNYPECFAGDQPGKVGQTSEERQLLPGQSRFLILAGPHNKTDDNRQYRILVTSAPTVAPPPTFTLPVMPTTPVSAPWSTGFAPLLTVFARTLSVTQRSVRVLNAPSSNAQSWSPLITPTMVSRTARRYRTLKQPTTLPAG